MPKLIMQRALAEFSHTFSREILRWHKYIYNGMQMTFQTKPQRLQNHPTNAEIYQLKS